MGAHVIRTIQYIPAERQEVWSFFSDARNLASITPPEMDFRIISAGAEEPIYAGQIIEYKLKPVAGLSVYWMTEITHVKELEYFVDEQRKGPYGLWHHQHHFREVEGGVEMRDIVHYRNPLGVLGRLANALYVKNRLEAIFEYRRERVEREFGKWKGPE